MAVFRHVVLLLTTSGPIVVGALKSGVEEFGRFHFFAVVAHPDSPSRELVAVFFVDFFRADEANLRQVVHLMLGTLFAYDGSAYRFWNFFSDHLADEIIACARVHY